MWVVFRAVVTYVHLFALGHSPSPIGPSVGCDSALFILQLLSVVVWGSLGSIYSIFYISYPPVQKRLSTASAPALPSYPGSF